MSTVEQVTYNSPDGATIGKSTSEKVSFYGVTPIAQRSGSAQAALTLTTMSLGGYGFTTQTGADAAVALLVEIRAALVALGVIKGSS